MTITDPVAGELTFDALAAGDPARAATGRLVVLLHGFPETAEAYRDVLPALAGAGYHAVALTQRGYSPGARPADVERYRVVDLGADVLAVATELGADEFHLVGHDWGGGVAWLLAGTQPERVRSLTVLGTPHPDAMSTGIADPGDPQHAASAYMADLRAEGSEQRLLADGRATFEALFGPDGGGLPADRVAAYADVLATPEALGAALAWYRANPLPLGVRLGPVAVPTLYLWGSEDRTFARTSAERTGALVEAPYTFVEVHGAGHWLPERSAGAVLDALVPHLDAAG